MLHPDFSYFSSTVQQQIFSNFYSRDNLFLIIEIKNCSDKEQIRDLINNFIDKIIYSSINTLSSFEEAINNSLKVSHLPTDISLVCGYVKDDVLYLKTIGEGIVFIKRNKDFAKIIENNNSASGYIDKGDLYIFTTASFISTLSNEHELRKTTEHHKFSEISGYLNDKLSNKKEYCGIALFINMSEENKEEVIPAEEKVTVSMPKIKFWQNIKSKLHSQDYSNNGQIKSKKFTFLAVILIFLILVWSVGLGYQRRLASQKQKEMVKTKELVLQKMNQADDVAFLNLPRALSLISESREEVKKLKNKYKDINPDEVNKIEAIINAKEGEFLKKEEKKAREFSDLALENKDAKGYRMYLDKDNLAILDKRGVIYTLSLSKKSLDKTTSSLIKQASLVGLYNDSLFFYTPQEGIFKIEDNKPKKVIEYDKDWGDIADFAIYNSNIYLLDKGKDEIYKYLAGESGYSSKNSYFKEGQAIDLSEAQSITIDSSVYISFKDNIVKYTAGDRDGFSTSFPDSNISITKVFTSKDSDKVYAWDKEKGSIYILDKKGTYEKQIDSTILKKTDDFAVFDKKAYALLGSKIYEIAIE